MKRYAKQTKLNNFGPDQQEQLAKSSVLVVGAGGLGVPVLQYLNSMGIGTLGIADGDVIEESNLARQVIYTPSDIGKPKVERAKYWLQQQNPETKIEAYQVQIEASNTLEIVSKYDLIVDATDNFSSKYLLNDVAVLQNRVLVYGAVEAFEGQVSVFNYNNGPTYRCLFPNMPKANEIKNCNEVGVLGILPSIIGSFQALEVVKVITGIGDVLSGKLLIYDGLSQHSRIIQFNKQFNQRSSLQDSYDLPYNYVQHQVTAAKLYEKIKLGEQAAIIDVRTAQEFRLNHLARAKNIPLDQLDAHWNEFTDSKPIYIICQSGTRSLQAIEYLNQIKPELILIQVTGGMNAIKQQKDE